MQHTIVNGKPTEKQVRVVDSDHARYLTFLFLMNRTKEG